MPELIATPALPHPPLTLAGTTLALADPGEITALALFPGQEKAAAKALKPLGLGFPAPNAFAAAGAARLVWTGRAQAFLIGAPPPADFPGAVIGQTDGWAALRLDGPAAAAALMRLVPLDLRAMAPGQAARAPLNHMQMVLWREAEGFALMVFRSMAQTAWHEIATALRAQAARAALAAGA